ncbi:hypothetical protein D3C73_1382030 [compost metagenome]
MEAGLRFVQDHELRGPRRQQGRGEQEEPQRPVREFGCLHGPQHARLAQLHTEAAVADGDLQPASRKGVIDGGIQLPLESHLAQRLECGREILATVVQHRGACSKLRLAGGSLCICAEMIVEAP